MPKAVIENRLAQVRASRGIAVSELARRVNVSRQTIYAIEAGTYVPNTEVALHLARELEVSLEELFSLRGASPLSQAVKAELLGQSPPAAGQPVRVSHIGARWVGVPVSSTPFFIPEADGIVRRSGRGKGHADVMVFAKEEAAHKRLLLAGCDPATSLVSGMVERISGIEIVPAPASSRLSLQWLKEGKVHIAGTHLQDPGSGEFNVPFARESFPGEDLLIVTFAHWEEGLVVAAGNPKAIRRAEDLGRRGVRLINRESGSGSRALLDHLLAQAGLAASKVRGYERVAPGHLPAAYQVATGGADVCLATRPAARTFGLGFVPLRSARYDLVMRKRTGGLPAVKAFLDVLQRAALRKKLEVLAGYDTSQTGNVVSA